ncbi:MAG: PAS domain S-box protein, partial [Salinivirgaceae bacterium]
AIETTERYIRVSALDQTKESELREQASFRAAIIENVQECIFAMQHGKITFWNRGATELLGYNANYTNEKNPHFLFPEIDRSFFTTLPDDPKQLNKKHFWKAQTATNRSIELEIRISKLEHEEGEPIYIFVGQDISLHKKANEVLTHSQKQITTVLDSIESRVYISDPETNEVLFANKPMQRAFPKIMTEPCHKAIHSLNQKCPFCKQDELLNSEHGWLPGREEFSEKENKWLYVSEKIIPWTNERQAVIHTLTDISKLKKSQLAVKENEALFSKLTQAAKDSIITIDHKGLIRFWNLEAAKMFGYTKEEVYGKDLHNLLAPNDLKKLAHKGLIPFSKTGVGKVIDSTYEMPAIRKDGTTFLAELSVASVLIKEQWHAIGIIRDVTERKEREAALNESREQYQKLIENIGEGIGITNEKEVFTFCNHTAEKIFEVPSGTLVGRSLSDFTSKEEFERLSCYTTERKENKKSQYQAVIKTPKGTIKHIQVIAAPYFEKGAFIGTFGAFSDITKQKEAEQRLIENEKRYRNIVNNTKDALYIHDLDGNFIDCNQALLDLTGYTRGEIKKIAASDLLNSNEKTIFQNKMKQLPANKQGVVSMEMIAKSGTIIPVEINASLIEYKGKMAVLASGRNITERIQEKKKLIESENRFRTMADNVPDSIFIHEQNGKFIDVNQKAVDKLEYTKQELLQMAPMDISEPLGNSEDYKNIMSILNTTGKTYFEDVHITKSGKRIPVSIQAVIIDYQGKKVVLSVAHDISNRKQAEKEQSKLINQLNYLSNSATKLISFQKLENIFKYTGKSLSEVLENAIVVVHEYKNGYLHPIDLFDSSNKALPLFDSIIHKNPLENKYKLPTDRMEKYMNGYLEQGGDLVEFLSPYFDKEELTTINQKLGTVETYSIGVTQNNRLYAAINILMRTPINYREKEFIQALVYQTSIAIQRKLYTNELVTAKKSAEEANKAKSAFLTNISHEIRTPMNTILGFTEILAKTLTNEKEQNYLNAIATSGKNLLQIINDILDLSRLESGKMSLNITPTSILTLANDMSYLLEKGVKHKKVSVGVQVNKGVPTIVKTDQPRLRQILQNLITNALKFTQEGFIHLRIGAKNTTDDTTDLIFTVTDTGIGIDSHKIEHITETFRQIDNSDSRKFEGAGMGLAIAKKLTELLNGTLTVQSELGKGSSFTVTLNKIKISEHQTSSYKKPRTKPSLFNKEKVLIIENDNNQSQLIQGLLSETNLITFTAESGEQAFAFAHEFLPELIIIDLVLDQNNNLKSAQAIKNSDITKDIPILAIYGEDERIVKTQQLSKIIADVVILPITKSQLISKISEHIIQKTIVQISPEHVGFKYSFEEQNTDILKEIQTRLAENATPLWKKLKKRQPLKQVREFEEAIRSIAQEYDI